DAKEVGVGNPAEETYRYPNQSFLLPTLSIGPQMSIHKGPPTFINVFLQWASRALISCSLCVARQASNQPCAPFVRQIRVRPAKKHRDLVPQPNQKNQMNEQPR